MASLIKSSRVVGEPVVLVRPRAWDEREAQPLEMPAPTADAPSTMEEPAPASLESVDAAHDLITDLPEADPDPLSISYEEYRQRFETELRALEEQAQREGFERGQLDGLEQAKAEYESQLTVMADLINAMRASLDQTIDGVAELGIEVVSESVAKIIGEATVSPDIVLSVVREVIRHAKERTKLVVRVSRADWSILEGREAELVAGLSVGSVEIVADDRVQAGGCLLETAAGNLDGRLEVQLERLREALMSARAADRETESMA